MVKNNLKMREILVLSEEIHGLQDKQTGSKTKNGLLDEKISLVQKYWLTDLGNKIKELSENIESLRNELIQKYGEEFPDGSIGISLFNEVKDNNGEVLSKEPNPKWQKFQKEYDIILSQEKEIEHYEFLLEDLSDLKTENRYTVFITKIAKI